MLNVEVINKIPNNRTRCILKNILFDDNNIINWNEAYELMMSFMPELNTYEGYKHENMMEDK